LGKIKKLTPLGLLLSELEYLGSHVLEIAKKSILNDIDALAVDKTLFSLNVTSELKRKGAQIYCEKIKQIPDDNTPLIIATGPLTPEELMKNIAKQCNLQSYTFYDASSPVIDGSSLQYDDLHLQKLSNDLFILKITDEEFDMFFNVLLNVGNSINYSIDRTNDFIQCQSLENIAKKGKTFLISNRFTYDDMAVPALLLRRETALREAFILVGCTTALGHKEQISLFSTLPVLRKVKIIRYGRQHRNSYFKTPGVLNSFFQVKNKERDIFIIGQLSGLDGYAPAIASGYVAARKIINKDKMREIPCETMIGALSRYVAETNVIDYQPMCASFSLLKKDKSYITKEHSLQLLSEYLNQ
jgi:methylenetetrahydrofolate--tRNA-(uracil-5-)-methyltransferase